MRIETRDQQRGRFLRVLFCGLVGMLHWSSTHATIAQNQGQKETPLKPAAETIKKWEAAGGEFGWVSLTKLSALGGCEFYAAEQEPQPDWLPAFRFGEVVKANFPELPDPNVPFALTVSNTNFDNTKLKAITKFQQLAALDLTNTEVSDDGLNSLSKMVNLKALSLNLGFLKVSDEGLKVLEKLTELTTLDLGSTLASDTSLDAVAQMKNLVCLRLNNTQITEKGLAGLSKLKKLATLDLSSNNVSADWLVQIANCSQLSTLYLGATGVGDAELAVLPKFTMLTTLDLVANKFSDAGLEPIGKMHHLKYLNVAHNSLTEEGRNSLRRRLPGCKIDF